MGRIREAGRNQPAQGNPRETYGHGEGASNRENPGAIRCGTREQRLDTMESLTRRRSRKEEHGHLSSGMLLQLDIGRSLGG